MVIVMSIMPMLPNSKFTTAKWKKDCRHDNIPAKVHGFKASCTKHYFCFLKDFTPVIGTNVIAFKGSLKTSEDVFIGLT